MSTTDIESLLQKILTRTRVPEFVREVAKTPRGKGIQVCIQCGRCSGSCPVARFTNVYNPRRLNEMVMLGFRSEELFTLSWNCLSCFTCLDRCPQGGDVGEIVLALRSIAAREGLIPKAVATMAKNIIETGHLVNPSGMVSKQREKLGLPETSKPKDVQKIADKAGMVKLISKSK